MDFENLSRLAALSGSALASALQGRWNRGTCSICDGPTVFLEIRPWLRDFYVCVRCRSIPRQRALMSVVRQHVPDWPKRTIHESSPSGPTMRTFARGCPGYLASYWFEGQEPGTSIAGARCENLEDQTFADRTFDVVITQDVLEHVFDPGAAFREIARTLRPGGLHIFTTPMYRGRRTTFRARRHGSEIEHLRAPEYHRNPIDAHGSLVTVEWGEDIVEFIRQASRLETEIHSFHDPSRGLAGQFLDVFVSRAQE